MTKDKQDLGLRLSQLQGFLRQDPANIALRADVFDAALAAGDFGEAGYQVAQALHADPADAGWLQRESLLLLAQGHYPQAEVALTGLIEAGHGDPATHYNLAYAQFGQGRHAKAQEALGALRDDPGELGGLAWTLWLRCEHHLLHLEEGLQSFMEALTHRLLPAEAWGVASLMAIDANRLEDAKTWSEHALKVDPDQLEALVASGSLAIGRQAVQPALERFEHALRINPRDGRSWSGLAFTHLLNLDFQNAEQAFKKAVGAMPDHIGTWIGLGWCEFLAQRPQEAQAAFEQALALDRNFGESHGALAVVLAQLGQRERAKNEIDLAIHLDPKGLSARYAQALLGGEANDPTAFLRMARRALAQHPAPFPGEHGTARTLADVVLRFRR